MQPTTPKIRHQIEFTSLEDLRQKYTSERFVAANDSL